MEWKRIETATENDLPFLAANHNAGTGETWSYSLIRGMDFRVNAMGKVFRTWVDKDGKRYKTPTADLKQDGSIEDITHWTPISPVNLDTPTSA